jgi:hypothetical protein
MNYAPENVNKTMSEIPKSYTRIKLGDTFQVQEIKDGSAEQSKSFDRFSQIHDDFFKNKKG